MPGIASYSTTPAANTALFPEGMAPSAVNDGMRQVQADIRAWYQDAQWLDLGHAPVYTSATSFTVSGDQTAQYHVGRRVRATGSAPFTIYGSITGVAFASDTAVTVAWDSGGLDNTLLRIELGLLGAVNPAAPSASPATAGVVELAEAAEVAAGTDTQRAVTPAGLASAVAFQGRQTVWVPASAMIVRISNGATPGTIETPTNRVMRRTLDFDAATPEFAQFLVAMPKSWNEGAVSAEFLWTAAEGTGAVIWGLQALALSDDDAFDGAFGATQEVADALLAAGDLHRTAETPPVTIAGAPTEGDLVVFQVHRNAASGADTLNADAQLIGVRLFYTTNARNDA